MRKRDKKKEKSRAESKEKTKREAYVDVVLKGAKRGAGHRQRVSVLDSIRLLEEYSPLERIVPLSNRRR